jgi:hypothetical protein
MATQGSKSKSKSGSRSRSNGSNRRRSSSRSKRDFEDYAVVDPKKIPDGPDVLLDVPVVKVDEIDLEIDDLYAQVAVSAQVQRLVQLSVGVEVHLGNVELKIEGVEAQALLKARLHNVSAILERVVTTLDRNPKLLESIGKAVEDVGGGAGHMLDETGDAVEDVGQGAGQGVGQIGQGAGQAVRQVGQGAGRGVAGVGQGAQQATQQLAQGGGQ